MSKFQLQEDEYSFPYNYLTSLNNNVPSIYKRLGWGYEYITYIDFIANYIEEKIKPISLLDIGCGDGFLINNLKYNKTKKINGIDLSKKAILFAKAFSNGYNFYCKDLFDIKEKYNTVCLIEVLEQIKQANFEIVDQLRLYKKSKLLERLIKFSQNQNSKTLKKIVWNWHKKNTYFPDRKNGKHLITVYKRIS